MKQYIDGDLRTDIKYLIQKVTELNNKQINNKMDNKMKEDEQFKRKETIRLFDRFDWAAIGVAVAGIVLFIHLIIKLKG